MEKILEKIKNKEEYKQLLMEIESKLKILNALIANNSEVNDILSKTEKEKGNFEIIKKEEEEKNKLKEDEEKERKRLEAEGLIKDSQTGQIYHYATYSRLFDKDLEDEEENKMSRRYLDKILCSDYKQYYRTHELNEILYLHYKSFKKIDNLHTFINLKCLYLEGNAISKIEGLDKLVNLTSLYLHENCIEKIEGLDTLKRLANLNLSDNLIKKIEGLNGCESLSNLLLKRNRIGIKGLSDLQGLIGLGKEFTVLDISDNLIDEPKIVDEILTKFEDLRVIYLNGNECVRKIPNYRKTLISKIGSLKYIDDKPVFDDEKRFALAFARGGYEEERKERQKYREEIREKEEQRIRDFCKMMNQFKDDAKEDENKKKMNEEEREKQKLALLKKIKNKNKDIFTGEDINRMPEIKKSEILSQVKQEKNENEIKEINISTENNKVENNNNDDEPPELEEVKNIEEAKSNEKINKEKENNIDTTTKNKSIENNYEKREEEKNEKEKDNYEKEKKRETEENEPVKIKIKEADLDELD